MSILLNARKAGEVAARRHHKGGQLPFDPVSLTPEQMDDVAIRHSHSGEETTVRALLVIQSEQLKTLRITTLKHIVDACERWAQTTPRKLKHHNSWSGTVYFWEVSRGGDLDEFVLGWSDWVRNNLTD